MSSSSSQPSVAPVTVIVPTHNRLGLLELALRSVLRQTYTRFTVLVWDDAGTVDVQGLLARLGDDRLVYRRNERNLGMAATNEAAFHAVDSEFVAHLDDDDEWEPRFLEKLVPALEREPRAGLAFCDHVIIDSEGRVMEEATEWNSKLFHRATLSAGLHQPSDSLVVRQVIPVSCCAVIRTDALDLNLYVTGVRTAWDLWMAYLVARSRLGAYYVPERLVRYRHHGSQSTTRAQAAGMLEDTIYVYERILNEGILAVDGTWLRAKIASVAASWAIALARDGEVARARRIGRSAVRRTWTLRGGLVAGLASLPSPLAQRLATGADAMRSSLLWRG